MCQQRRQVGFARLLGVAERPIDKEGHAQLPALGRIAQVAQTLGHDALHVVQMPPAADRLAFEQASLPPMRLVQLLVGNTDERRRHYASVLAGRGRRVRHEMPFIATPQQQALTQRTPP